MKLLYLVKYFPPYDRGGSEWSTFDLSRQINGLGHNVTILTPNYGYSKSEQHIDGVYVKRMPFILKLKNPKAVISPFWTSNFVWFVYTFVYIFWTVFKGNYDVIHIQNNEFIPGGVAVGKFLRRKTIITFRDYQSLCPHSFCLWNSKTACRLSNFVNDINFFYTNYSNGGFLNRIIVYLSSYRAYFWSRFIFYFSKHANIKIAVSEYVAEIFRKNGLKDIKVINNVVKVNCPETKIKNKESRANGRGSLIFAQDLLHPRLESRDFVAQNKSIVFVGKLSLGKGVDVLLDACRLLLEAHKEFSVIFIGSGYLSTKLEELANTRKFSGRITIKGQMGHDEVLRIIKSSALLVAPSSWPEPLPRVVIESLVLGTPVVATKAGGISEILQGKYGLLVDKQNPSKLTNAILSIIKNLNKYKSDLKADNKALIKRFSSVPALKYAQLYEI